MPKPRSERVSARHRERLCVVMACENAAEAAQVGEQVLKLNTVSLVTYRRAEDVVLNSPAGKVALIVLATGNDPKAVAGNLAWMRRRWPHCPITVIGEKGGGSMEMAARIGGACYFTRPVSPDQWAEMLRHVLSAEGRPTPQPELG